MPDVSARTGANGQAVIYAGRFADQVADADLPENCIVLGEREAPSCKLTRALDRANMLIFMDLPSFSTETMISDHWDVPIFVVIPSDFTAESLAATCGPELFEQLGFFDRIVTQNSALWEVLRQKYHWAESQRIPVAGNPASEVTGTVQALMKARPSSPVPEENGIDPDSYLTKALHRVQAAVIEPRFAAAQEKRDTKVPFDVLEVGSGVGRWASSFHPANTRFVGIDAREDLLGEARANFPDQRFDRLGPDLLLPYREESFDLVFSVTVMHLYSTSAKRTLLSEMWRVVRPGGWLLLLENFVFTGQSEKPTIYPMSVTEFANLIVDTTAEQVVLDHVESLQYPGEDLRRGGLISLMRLGVPKI